MIGNYQTSIVLLEFVNLLNCDLGNNDKKLAHFSENYQKYSPSSVLYFHTNSESNSFVIIDCKNATRDLFSTELGNNSVISLYCNIKMKVITFLFLSNYHSVRLYRKFIILMRIKVFFKIFKNTVIRNWKRW